MYRFGLLISCSVLCVTLFCSGGCKKDYDYDAQVAAALRSGERHDSIFFGLYLGMLRNAFRAQCLDLNHQKRFQQGTKGPSVEYHMHELRYPAAMNFLPRYDGDTLIEMGVIYEYDRWAPWDKSSHSVVLIEDVYKLFIQWYGKPFHTVTLTNGKKVLVQVKGNRRVILYAKDDREVHALITDLTRSDPALEGLDL